jgi:selenocysteine lyase/cysteine desulfurase
MLYLDTARLGQTTSSAVQAQIDFTRLTAEQPSSLYTDRFLAEGIAAAPNFWAERFPGLSHWRGVEELKYAILTAAGAPGSHSVAVASRSTLLMRTAARSMYRRCRNVLVTDLSWPAYQSEIADAAARTNRRFTVFACRDRICREHISADRLATEFAEYYRKHSCDGIFLPLVDNLGTRLPIRRLLSEFNGSTKPRFVLVDGAQAIGHLPIIDVHEICDVFIAGAHKWVRAGQPLGFAIYGRRRSREWLSRCFGGTGHQRPVDDSLSCFVASLTTHTPLDQFSETVNVSPLLSCRAALTDLPQSSTQRQVQWKCRNENRDRVSQLASELGWCPLTRSDEYGSGIVTIHNGWIRNARRLRERLTIRGIAVSCYEGGIMRLSMPEFPLSESQFGSIGSALCHVQELATSQACGSSVDACWHNRCDQ